MCMRVDAHAACESTCEPTITRFLPQVKTQPEAASSTLTQLQRWQPEGASLEKTRAIPEWMQGTRKVMFDPRKDGFTIPRHVLQVCCRCVSEGNTADSTVIHNLMANT